MLYHGTTVAACEEITRSGALLSLERRGVTLDAYRSTHIFMTPHPLVAYRWATHRATDAVILGFRIRSNPMVPDQVPLDTLAEVFVVSQEQWITASVERLFSSYRIPIAHCTSELELERLTRP